MSTIREIARKMGVQCREETPEERARSESLLAAVRAAAAPGPWRPSGADATPMPVPVAAAAPPMVATPPAPAPSSALVAASRPAPLAPPAMRPPAPPQPSAAAMWSEVASDLNTRMGFAANGSPAAGLTLAFIEPHAGRSAGPLWDAVAEKLNAEVRAGATPEAPTAAGGQPADLWGAVAASVNAAGRAANAAFTAPAHPHSARNAHPRIS